MAAHLLTLKKKMIFRIFVLPLAVAAAGCTATRSYEEVAETIQSRTGKVIHLPGNQLSQYDVNASVTSLLKRPVTAESAAQIALLNSRRVRATLEELNLSQADLLEASIPSNPSLASSVRFPNEGGGRNVEAGLTADILNLMLLPLRKSLALREYEAAKKRISHELLDVIFETKEAFYEFQGELQIMQRIQTTAQVNQVSSDIAKRLRDAGNITALEMLQEQTNAQQSSVDISRAKGAIAVAREKVNRLLGLTTAQGASWNPSDQLLSMPRADPKLAAVEAAAVANRQDLAAQAETLAAFQQGYGLTTKMRYLTALDIGVNHERETDGARLTGPTLDIELPIFNFGQARVLKAKAEVAKATATYEAIDLEVRSDVRRAWQQLNVARQLYQQITSSLLPQRQKILGETLLQYNAMQLSNFVLLQAKTSELEAQRAAVEALRDYWIARAELEKAAGGSLIISGSGSKASTEVRTAHSR